MSVIKPPSGVGSPVIPQATGPQSAQPAGSAKVPAGGAEASMPVISPEAVAKALKDYQKIHKKLKQPFLAGAAGLFTDSVVFPQELLDPNNPANDPKYLHLLFAVFGLKELEKYLKTAEQAEEAETEEEAEKRVKKSAKKEGPQKTPGKK